MISVTMLGAMGGALHLARNIGIGLFLWFCVSVLLAPLVGMWLHRRSQELAEVPESTLVIPVTPAIWEELDGANEHR